MLLASMLLDKLSRIWSSCGYSTYCMQGAELLMLAKILLYDEKIVRAKAVGFVEQQGCSRRYSAVELRLAHAQEGCSKT